jgi:hypothetical protein
VTVWVSVNSSRTMLHGISYAETIVRCLVDGRDCGA